MRKIILLLLAMICLDSFAQTTMRDVLKAMPARFHDSISVSEQPIGYD